MLKAAFLGISQDQRPLFVVGSNQLSPLQLLLPQKMSTCSVISGWKIIEISSASKKGKASNGSCG